MLYTVSEVAKILNVAPSTIRYYDKEGLLPFVERSTGGIRVFTEADLGWLKTISCLKNTGMPIKTIRLYVESAMQGDDTIDTRLSIIYEQRERLLEQMKELQLTLDIVEYKCWYYETAQKAGTEKVLNAMTLADIPEKYHPIIEHLHGKAE